MQDNCLCPEIQVGDVQLAYLGDIQQKYLLNVVSWVTSWNDEQLMCTMLNVMDRRPFLDAVVL